jgi:GTP-binding protein
METFAMIKFIGSFETVESLPKARLPEYAFVGRSNVGKSSLLNALVGQKIARTSNTPGRTQSINLFDWKPSPARRTSCAVATPPMEGNTHAAELPPYGGPSATPTGGVTLADLPGYGYAKASKSDIIKWAARLEKYLLNRAQLKRLFILVDSRHGLKLSDTELMEFCNANAIQFQIVLTKADKTKKAEVEKLKSEVEIEVKKHGAACAKVCATSAEKKVGIEELKNEIAA